jgi:hypothetical protein
MDDVVWFVFMDELGFAASISAPSGVILNREALPKSRGESYTGFGRLRASGEERRSISVESRDLENNALLLRALAFSTAGHWGPLAKRRPIGRWRRTFVKIGCLSHGAKYPHATGPIRIRDDL